MTWEIVDAQNHQTKSRQGVMKLVHKLLITIEHLSKLTRCIDDVRILDSQFHQRKGGRIYEPIHKLLITIEHWSKLTICIDDVGIVDSQYHQTKGSMRYETVHKLLITIEHWSKLTSCIDEVYFSVQW